MDADTPTPTPGWLRAEAEADLTLWLPGDGDGDAAEVPMFFRRVPAVEGWPDDSAFPARFRLGQRNSGQTGEEPVHTVTLSRPFCIATFPVTQAQWRGLARRAGFDPDPSQFKGDFLPVENISWKIATVWCKAVGHSRAAFGLTDRAGKIVTSEECRLPTEAEWEIACRAGTDTEYHGGDGEAALREAGWFGEEWESGSTHPVGEKAANGWGLFDLHGNVWEWCRDVWYDHPYVLRPDGVKDPETTPETPGSVPILRVVRGGSWFDAATRCRSAYRFRWRPASRIQIQGFRPVLCLPWPAVSLPGPAEPE